MPRLDTTSQGKDVWIIGMEDTPANRLENLSSVGEKPGERYPHSAQKPSLLKHGYQTSISGAGHERGLILRLR